MTIRRTALVTGSTSGIGLGIAGALAAAGHNVVLNGFGDTAAIHALRARLAADHGVDVRHDGADMAQPAAIATMMERAIGEFGAVDILVNNAGIQHVAAGRGVPDREVGRDHRDQPVVGVPHRTRRRCPE